jgi:methylated-DNA-[protein]-cysteine S-methyltransferase
MVELSRVDSPVGLLTVAMGPRGLRALSFDNRLPDVAGPAREGRPPKVVADALAAYFRGDLRAIDWLEIDPRGTEFQRRVWATLRTIPAGTTWSYARLARAVGQPSAMRAVGAANGRNPIALVVPCHRVIASDGTLGGYGGGLDKKRWLLRHEGSWPAQAELPLPAALRGG